MASLTTGTGTPPAIEALQRAAYINLITFRKNGTPVATPLWSAEHQGTLYVETSADSGKVKRIRRNARIQVFPCTARGQETGETVEGKARIVDSVAESYIARGALHRKYGFKRQAFRTVMALGTIILRRPATTWALIAIEPEAQK